jgi:electron transfer flavoprotein beta subunit
MKILVLIKQVPDTWGARHLDLATGRADRATDEQVTDEVGERAVEAALLAKDAFGAEVIVATMGPAGSTEALRKTLAMGADSAIHLLDDTLAGSDLVRTARMLHLLVQRCAPDLVIAGNESTDGRGGMIPAMLAELAGWPHATSLRSIEFEGAALRGTRVTEVGTEELACSLPAVVSVTEQAPEPRFASFRGIMKAKKKPLERITVADLGGAEVLAGAGSVVMSTAERPPRTAGSKIVDEGNAGRELADYLIGARLI